SSGERKGAGMFCLQWSIEQSEEIRVDTHEANLPMQRLLEKNGFVKCGKIQVADGTERIAFQLKK
ncbi:MAG: GNAT family N-acetyltransferase, partial [Faecalimonas umbilicata]|nr:GNAT family N-acetyltransferase [Faecalimonas umbilicata]